eukprot:6172851-Pleurochrysis_carterae.AAC.2
MATASERADKQFNAPAIPFGGHFPLKGRVRGDRSGHRSWTCGAGGTVPRAEAGGGWHRVLPPTNQGFRNGRITRPSRGYGQGDREGSAREGERDGPHATAPDPISLERGREGHMSGPQWAPRDLEAGSDYPAT